jgi:hypothetical protein
MKRGLVTIDESERGVVISALEEGVRSEVLQPGQSWVTPYLEKVVIYPISVQVYEMGLSPRGGLPPEDDLIQLRAVGDVAFYADVSTEYSLHPENVLRVHLTWGDEYESGLVRPRTRKTVRDVLAAHTAAGIGSISREEFERQIEVGLRPLLEEEGLLLHSLTIRAIYDEQAYLSAVDSASVKMPPQGSTKGNDRGKDLGWVLSPAQNLAFLVFLLGFGLGSIRWASRKKGR